jgi:hypothetical protein
MQGNGRVAGKRVSLTSSQWSIVCPIMEGKPLIPPKEDQSYGPL